MILFFIFFVFRFSNFKKGKTPLIHYYTAFIFIYIDVALSVCAVWLIFHLSCACFSCSCVEPRRALVLNSICLVLLLVAVIGDKKRTWSTLCRSRAKYGVIFEEFHIRVCVHACVCEQARAHTHKKDRCVDRDWPLFGEIVIEHVRARTHNQMIS